MSRHAAKIPGKIRRMVYARDGHKCVYCGAAHPLTLDHILPRCQGGTSNEKNLCTACARCNSYKAGRTPQEWRV